MLRARDSIGHPVGPSVARLVGRSVHCFLKGQLVILTCITAPAHPTLLMLSCIRPCLSDEVNLEVPEEVRLKVKCESYVFCDIVLIMMGL